MESVTFGNLETTKPELTGNTLQNCFPLNQEDFSEPFMLPYHSEMFIMLNVKKLHENAKLPKQDKPGDAGYDLYALEDTVVPSLFKSIWTYAIQSIKYMLSPRIFMMDDERPQLPEFKATKIKTGIAMEIPYGCVGLISDRSGMGSKLLKVFGGVIDSTYRGDVTVCLGNFSFVDHHVKAGDRVAQIVITECKSYPVVDVGDKELSKTVREDKGFGSSGS